MLGDEFECPKCQALYKMVRVSSGPEILDRLVYCKVCNQPLAPTLSAISAHWTERAD